MEKSQPEHVIARNVSLAFPSHAYILYIILYFVVPFSEQVNE